MQEGETEFCIQKHKNLCFLFVDYDKNKYKSARGGIYLYDIDIVIDIDSVIVIPFIRFIWVPLGSHVKTPREFPEVL